MAFAIELFLDPASAAVIRRGWDAVTRAGLASPASFGEAQPHVSFGIFDTLELAGLESVVRDFAAAVSALPLRFTSVATFTGEPAVAYLAPDATPELLAVHERFHARFRGFPGTLWAHYLPGQWVPHCTLAQDVPRALVRRALAACQNIPLPVLGRLEEVAVVEFRPIRQRCSFRLGG